MKCVIQSCKNDIVIYNDGVANYYLYCKKHQHLYSKRHKATVPMEINIDTVKELRRRGLGMEAEKVVSTYHENKRNNKYLLKKDLDREYRLKNRIKVIRNVD